MFLKINDLQRQARDKRQETFQKEGRFYTQPGAVNDPDEIYVGQNPPSLSPIEEQTVFAMWAMLTGPLLLGIVSEFKWPRHTHSASSTWVLLYIRHIYGR